MVEPKYTDLHRVAVTGIVWQIVEGKRTYLITKRSPYKKVWPEKWTVPGGGMEVNDYIHNPPSHEGDQWYNTAEKTLRREIKEETGLEVDDVRFLLDLTTIQSDGTPSIILSYYCKYLSGEVVLDEDSTEFKWVTTGEAKEYDLVPGILEEIQRVDDLVLLQG